MAKNNGPHKAVIRVIADVYPIDMSTGELDPLSVSQDCVITEVIYGQDLQECLQKTSESMEKWKNKTA